MLLDFAISNSVSSSFLLITATTKSNFPVKFDYQYFSLKSFFPILLVDDVRFVRYSNGPGSAGNSLLLVFSFAILAITNTSISFFT